MVHYPQIERRTLINMSAGQKLSSLPRAPGGFSVPENPYGFRAHHTKSNRQIPHEKLTSLYKHVLGPIHQKVLDQIDADIKAEQN